MVMISLQINAEIEGNYMNPTEKLMRMLDMVFDDEIDASEKRKLMQTRYNIPYDDDLNQALEEIQMTIDDREYIQATIEMRREVFIEEKIAEGKELATIELLRRYMELHNVNLDKAMDDLGIPEDEREHLANLMENNNNRIE